MAITDKDIVKLKKHFATRDDLARVESGIKSFRNEVMTGLDKVMGELEKAREDRIFARAKDNEQDQRLDGLEKRVEKVETKV